jgi:hypothetical protein
MNKPDILQEIKDYFSDIPRNTDLESLKKRLTKQMFNVYLLDRKGDGIGELCCHAYDFLKHQDLRIKELEEELKILKQRMHNFYKSEE